VANDSLPQGPTQGPDGFVWIPPGKFMMGSSVEDLEAFAAEQPQHQVFLAPGFWMSDHEVTQGEFQLIMGSNPSAFKGDTNRPVEFVHMGEVMQYCQLLTKQQRAAGRITEQQEYRPPTEAEWEYACRAGSSGARYGDIKKIAWWSDNSGGETKPVKQKTPNAWGLYDMIGNVSEWCLDSYKSYSVETAVNPRDPTFDDTRVIRGGNWGDPTRNCRSTYRSSDGSGSKRVYLGFRTVLSEIR
jgi:formylglycine-generating enzyme required for sulfatase activity